MYVITHKIYIYILYVYDNVHVYYMYYNYNVHVTTLHVSAIADPDLSEEQSDWLATLFDVGGIIGEFYPPAPHVRYLPQNFASNKNMLRTITCIHV